MFTSWLNRTLHASQQNGVELHDGRYFRLCSFPGFILSTPGYLCNAINSFFSIRENYFYICRYTLKFLSLYIIWVLFCSLFWPFMREGVVGRWGATIRSLSSLVSLFALFLMKSLTRKLIGCCLRQLPLWVAPQWKQCMLGIWYGWLAHRNGATLAHVNSLRLKAYILKIQILLYIIV